MSIKQVRKVLDRRYGTHGLTDTINQQTAAEIDALYASERGGDDDDVADDLGQALYLIASKQASSMIAAAILRAIDARVGAKDDVVIESWLPDAHRRQKELLSAVLETLGDVCPTFNPPSDEDITESTVAAIRALAEAKAQAEMDAKRAADNLLAVQGLLHQAITLQGGEQLWWNRKEGAWYMKRDGKVERTWSLSDFIQIAKFVCDDSTMRELMRMRDAQVAS